MQGSLENDSKKFVNGEEIEVKNYGAIFVLEDESFFLTNDKNFNKGHKIVELHFHQTLFEKGWDKLSISAYKIEGSNSYIQSYLAGYLEGRATAMDIFHFYNNLRENTKKKERTYWERMKKFFSEVVSVMQNRVKNIKYIQEDTLTWTRLFLGYSQLEGLINGYTYEMKRLNKYNEDKYKLDLADFLILQADGEVPELLRYFRSFNVKTKIGEKNYFKDAFGIETEDPKSFWSQLMWSSKCSAFIKLTQDNKGMWKDLLVGHTTWTEYYEMIRTYKHYKFEFEKNNDLPASEMTFSSYPGCLSSTDDFYITNHNLVVTETTLEIIDIEHYKNVKSPKEYIPNFLRVLYATRFARNAKEWCQMFSKYNSGTYSSQWMILDYNVFNKIKNTKKYPDQMVYMMEQTPQKIVYHDISKHIAKHLYFGSYNRAFLKKTQHSLNNALINNLYGETFLYKGAARRKIINHKADSVNNLNTLNDLLRYNGYKQKSGFDDPSSVDPSKGISARSDLSWMSHLSGGIDTKVTNSELTLKMTAIAISGPTTNQNNNLSVFDWKQIKSSSPIIREGVPERFDFPYLLTNPHTICCDNKNDIYHFDNKK